LELGGDIEVPIILLFLNPLYHNPKPCNPSLLATTSLIKILTNTKFAKHTHFCPQTHKNSTKTRIEHAHMVLPFSHHKT